MKFTLSSLKKYLKTDLSAQQIADACTILGLEIESMVDKATPLANFIVGEIISEEKHPNADRLHLLKVSVGKGEPLQIVCGAPNAKKGLKGILARPGDVIPATGDTLEAGELRGVKSFGMMCSTRELRLGDDHSGIIELKDPQAFAGESAALALAREFDLDVLFDAEVTPNRPDYLGVMGIARDLAAGGYGEFVEPPLPKILVSEKFTVQVENKATELAKYFLIQEFRGVKNVESPKWLKDYLSVVGMNPHNALVDITNYMMHNMCRPLHVFDADKIKGKIVIEEARGGEKFVALDGNTYTLSKGDIAIKDDTGVISLAGVMGGLSTAVSENTKNVLVEAAYFVPAPVRMTSKRLGLESDSKYRFERGVDPNSCDWGLVRAGALIMEICGGQACPVIPTGQNPYRDTPLNFPVAFFKHRMGLELDRKEMARILTALGCVVSDKGAKLWITPPSWRADITMREDICEEIGRMYGYDKLPEERVLPSDFKPVLSARQARDMELKRVLAARGLSEAYTYSFMHSKDEIEPWAKGFQKEPIFVANPITAEMDVMRKSLVPNLLKALDWNNARSLYDSNEMANNLDSISLFEISPVFTGAEPGQQRLYAAAMRSGKGWAMAWEEKSGRDIDIYDIKADLFAALALYNITENSVEFDTENLPDWVNPYRSARVMIDKKAVAIFGEIHPSLVDKIPNRIMFFELDLDALTEKSKPKQPYVPAEFQPVLRALSFKFPASVQVREIYSAITMLNEPLISDITVFDKFEDSFGISLVIQPKDSALTDAQIAAIVAKAQKACEKLGGKLRQ